MPWITPTLEDTRSLNRDNIQAKLRSGPMIPNSVLRVMADSNAGLAYLTMLYLDWLAKQLMPDTSETEWLDRHGNIWVGGRKAATFATGSITVTGIDGTTLAEYTELQGGTGQGILFETDNSVTVSGPVNVNFTALVPGVTGLTVGSALTLVVGQAGIDGSLTVTSVTEGIPEETDDELRARVLFRIQEPPMGGDADDYVRWALEVPGVTRAWSAPNEMGIGTVTVRFMMDDIRATGDPMTNGFPNSGDVATVLAHLMLKKPVAVKDFYCSAPIPEPINFTISLLDTNDAATKSNITTSVNAMLLSKAKPSSALNGVLMSPQTIYAAWVSEAIMAASGVNSFDLTMSDHAMPDNGHMAVLGTITYV